MAWQPEKTAPLGEEIQIWTVGGWHPRARRIMRNSGDAHWEIWGLDGFDGMSWCKLTAERVTHWMPKPTPPQDL